MGRRAIINFEQADPSTAPLLEAVEIYDYQFEAELGAENVYKGHPRPELDAVWERVGRSEDSNPSSLLLSCS